MVMHFQSHILENHITNLETNTVGEMRENIYFPYKMVVRILQTFKMEQIFSIMFFIKGKKNLTIKC